MKRINVKQECEMKRFRVRRAALKANIDDPKSSLSNRLQRRRIMLNPEGRLAQSVGIGLLGQR